MSDPIPNPKDVLARTKGLTPIQPGEPKIQQEVTPFRSFMAEGGPNPLLEAGKTPQVSTFDLAHGRVPAPGPTFQTIQDQTKAANSLLGDINNQLNTPKLKLKQSSKYLLKNKLNSANAHIQSASSKLGAPKAEEEETPAGAGPLQRFLGMVTSGQNQLKLTQQHLADIAASGKEMRPADMLMIQIKLSKAQQELEYSSLLLGKAVDDLKMMMNIQL